MHYFTVAGLSATTVQTGSSSRKVTRCAYSDTTCNNSGFVAVYQNAQASGKDNPNNPKEAVKYEKFRITVLVFDLL